MMPSSISRDSESMGQWCGLNMRVFESALSDPNMQKRLRTTVLGLLRLWERRSDYFCVTSPHCAWHWVPERPGSGVMLMCKYYRQPFISHSWQAESISIFQKVFLSIDVLCPIGCSTTLSPTALQMILGIKSTRMASSSGGFIASAHNYILNDILSTKCKEIIRCALILLTDILNSFNACSFSSTSLKSSRRKSTSSSSSFLPFFSAVLSWLKLLYF